MTPSNNVIDGDTEAMSKRYLFLLPTLFAAITLSAAGTQTPRNIILFIGDGMGLSQVTAGRVASGVFNLDRFPVGGFVATHSQDQFVTDSAASATAYATGFKTTNGALSWSVFDKPLPTLFEYAQQEGKGTGVAVTCTLTHATPAAFMAHIDSRDRHLEIAEQIADSEVDVLIGGGWGYFVPADQEGSLRKDDQDLLAKLAARMPVVLSAEEMRKQTPGKALAAFLARKDPASLPDRDYSLAEVTRIALQVLSQSENGFVLLVEASQIDWRGHDNDTAGIVNEVIDFDGAVGEGLDFAQADGSTLVIVTADHETGGYAVQKGSVKVKEVTSGKFTTGGHTATMVPLFAYGPASEEFGGIHDNNWVGKKLISLVRTPSR